MFDIRGWNPGLHEAELVRSVEIPLLGGLVSFQLQALSIGRGGYGLQERRAFSAYHHNVLSAPPEVSSVHVHICDGLRERKKRVLGVVPRAHQARFFGRDSQEEQRTRRAFPQTRKSVRKGD